ncbi:MAG TPA: glycosyltransferase [Pyrinomonadaceae bacterium]|nr:glycosyltransferase [Pyrinomonadaceae bacterium]
MREPGVGDAEKIRVSLVVPVRDEAANINQLLESIAAQVRQPDEIVFVDGGSRDGTQDLLKAARAANPKVRVIEARKASPGLGRNIGITNARYDWIALTDAGNRLDPNWLERLLEVAESRPGGIICGNYEPVIDSFFTQCASIAYVPARITKPGGTVRGPFIASSLVTSEAWHSVGGFPDMRAAEDLIFFEELSKKGHSIEWAPGAVVHWELRPSLAATFRRFVLYSKWNVWGERQRHWHYRIALFYLAALPFLILGFIQSWWWLLVPLGVLFVRVAKRIWEHRENNGAGWVLNPLRFLGVLTITLAIDLATFVGWVGALTKPSQARKVRGMLQNLRYE